MNLAIEALPPEALLQRAMQIAHSFEGASPTAFSLSKRALGASLQSEFSTMLEMEAQSQAIAGSTTYFRESIRRSVSKEPGQFQWPGPHRG